jgi:alkanesulfonate monooxygenase SsuD/methylene tetrahydromethanopterin reductase-like flavin-dependent oxidoreductase (luciferase family)
MNNPRFSVFLSPHLSGLPVIADKVAVAEASGFDFVSIQDHPYSAGTVDTFALISHLTALTTRLRFMTDVANLPLRPAPMLARMSAGIDQLSGGRFELGLGGGRAWDQIGALGGPRWTPSQTVVAVGEAIDTLRATWTEMGTTATDSPHRIGIWLGAAGPRMLDLLGAKADGWIAPMSTPFASKPASQDRIDAAATAAGRARTDIHRIIQLVGVVDNGAGQRSGTQTTLPITGPGNSPIHADAPTWARIIEHFWTEGRFDTVNFIPMDETVDQIHRFAELVIPRARELIAGHR